MFIYDLAQVHLSFPVKLLNSLNPQSFPDHCFTLLSYVVQRGRRHGQGRGDGDSDDDDEDGSGKKKGRRRRLTGDGDDDGGARKGLKSAKVRLAKTARLLNVANHHMVVYRAEEGISLV